MIKVLAITTITNTLSLRDALDKIKREYGNLIFLKKIYLEDYEDPQVSLDSLKEDIGISDIILVDIRGDERIGRELIQVLDNKPKTVVTLVWGNPLIMNLTRLGNLSLQTLSTRFQENSLDLESMVRSNKLQKILDCAGDDLRRDIKNWFKIREYYGQNDAENLKNMLLFLLREYADMDQIKKVEPPQEMPEYGLYLPYRGIYTDLDDYKKASLFNMDQPTIGVLFYGGMHFDDTRPMAEALYEKLRDECNLIIAFSQVEHNLQVLKDYLSDIDLFVNLQYFQLNGGPMGGDPAPTHEFFHKNNIPYLISLRGYETDIEKWSKREETLNPMEIILGVTLPELDGGIEPVFTSALETLQEEEMGTIKVVSVIEERIDKLARRIINWIKLKNKKNSSKKVALLTYNYPPGEENLASSGYLDVFKSLEIFLKKLKNRNYHIEIPPSNLKDVFLEEGILNSPQYSSKRGIQIPVDDYREWFQNLPLEIQKEVISSWGEVPGDLMVEGDYFLIPGVELGNIFLGVQPTRGVHEDPENAYHDKELPPHHQYLAFYYYLEKVFQADAVLHFGMHGTLEFTPGKEVGMSSRCYPDILIGKLPNIYYYWVGNTSESTIAKRRSYALCVSHASPPMKSSQIYEDYLLLEDLLSQYRESPQELTLQLIMEKAEDLNLENDVDSISQELYRMKRRLIPMGLHILDKTPPKKDMVDYLLGVLRIDREYPSVLKLLSRQKNLIWENIKDTSAGEEIEEEARKIIGEILDKKEINLEEGYSSYVQDIASQVEFSQESEALLKALEGSYIIPARGGDPVRDPEVYPTGKSMYAFDPRQIPTVAADTRGKATAEMLIDSYFKKHGSYPRSVGLVLWGFETLKTGGDTISTILHLMGVKIKHQKGAWIKKLEIIPLKELGRPRIDVTINICGIFRDTLGTHIDLINRAIKQVASLEEDPEFNYLRGHFLEEDEDEMALARIYGPSPSEYATSLPNLVENSSWEEEQELVESYSHSMSYAYLPGKIKPDKSGLTRKLGRVDLVTQERDNVEYEVTDLDHYYEFLGGLSRTVEEFRGEKAEIMVSDSTEEEIYVEDLSHTINRATRTRLLNPKWLEGMLNHDFHGTKKIKDNVEHLLGFSATTKKVDNWVYDNVADKLIFDEEMRKKLQENNPYATIKMGELLMETQSRGYWEADEEKIKKLKEIVMNLESEVE